MLVVCFGRFWYLVTTEWWQIATVRSWRSGEQGPYLDLSLSLILHLILVLSLRLSLILILSIVFDSMLSCWVTWLDLAK